MESTFCKWISCRPNRWVSVMRCLCWTAVSDPGRWIHKHAIGSSVCWWRFEFCFDSSCGCSGVDGDECEICCGFDGIWELAFLRRRPCCCCRRNRSRCRLRADLLSTISRLHGFGRLSETRWALIPRCLSAARFCRRFRSRAMWLPLRWWIGVCVGFEHDSIDLKFQLRRDKK